MCDVTSGSQCIHRIRKEAQIKNENLTDKDQVGVGESNHSPNELLFADHQSLIYEIEEQPHSNSVTATVRKYTIVNVS